MRSHWRELALVLLAAALWGLLGTRREPAPPPPGLPQSASSLAQPVDAELISGRVVSGMNGQPLPRATVVGWGARRSVDPSGRFRFTAHQSVSLLVESPYFERKKVTLKPGRDYTIRLMPAAPID